MRFGRLSLIAAALALTLVLLAACTGDDQSGSAAAPAQPLSAPAAAPEPAPSPAPASPPAAAEPAEADPAPPPPADPPPRPAPSEPSATATADLDRLSAGNGVDIELDSTFLVSNSLVSEGPRVIRTAELAIWVEPGDFDTAIDRARTIASNVLGFVTNSSRQVYDERTELVNGSMTVRVPGERYALVMQRLAALGTVEQRSEHGEDVSREFVDLEARKRHLEAVELRLLGFLEETKTIKQALTVQNQVNDVQLQLEQIRGQLRFLTDQTSLSTITLAVTERDPLVVAAAAERAEKAALAEEKARAEAEAEAEEKARAKEEAKAKAKADAAAKAAAGDDSWGPLDAWRVPADGFLAVIGGAFVVLATVGPILAVAALAFFGWRILRRRRTDEAREAASPGAI